MSYGVHYQMVLEKPSLVIQHAICSVSARKLKSALFSQVSPKILCCGSA